jgi:ADP-heptose:LPS heptosyltransferase
MHLTAGDSREFFRDVIEPLCDAFEPRFCDQYVALFEPVIRAAVPGCHTRRASPAKPFLGDPSEIREIFVLSRITLGADVAVTSVILDAVKRRFQHAQVHFAGPGKNFELFNADPRLHHVPVSYGRDATIAERLHAGYSLPGLVDRPASIVVDPDSRLTQLGLIPVCPDSRYYFFESRAYQSTSEDSLNRLAQRWTQEIFGVTGEAYVSPRAEPASREPGLVCVSLGVGGNPGKQIAGPFEAGLLAGLVERGLRLLIDYGASLEEAERVDRALATCRESRDQVQTWRGAFAPFAAAVARARLFVGYDSSGQHVAAACGTPLVTIFAGAPNERFFQRWRPTGRGPIHVVRPGSDTLGQTLRAVDILLRS